MKRKLYYTLLILVTASCMLYGSFRHILQTRGQAEKEEFSNVAMEDGSGEFNQQLAEFDSIRADVSVCSITIMRGEKYSISGYYIKDMKSDFSIKKRVLIIRQNLTSADHVLGVHRDDNGIVITIPEEASLKRIDLESEVATLKFSGIDAKRCRVRNQTGDLLVDGMKTEYGMFVVDAGNIDMKDMDFERLHIRSGVSEVNVASLNNLDDCRVGLSTGAGNVEYNGKEYRSSYEEEGSSGRLLEITNGTGNVLVSHKAK